MDKEKLSQSVRNVMLSGLSPERAFEIFETCAPALELDAVVREITKELADKDIIHWDKKAVSN